MMRFGKGSRLGAGIEFECLATGFYLEALLVDGEDVWFTDVVEGGVRKVGGDRILLPERSMVGGLLLNEDGILLVSGGGGIQWVHPATHAFGNLVDGLAGVNEMRSDGAGGIYFGTIDLAAILAGRRPAPSSIQHLSSECVLSQVRGGLAFANGLSVSADGSFLYFNESFAAVRAFPIEKGGSLGEPITLLDMPDCDGMALDAEGNLWITGFASGELRCLRPDGSEVRRLALPGKACTNVRFGGADLSDLYVTIVDPGSAQALAEGQPLRDRNSAIYRTRSPVPGAPLATACFRLGRE
ncbi:MAG: gluconolactonase [Novosphingobium sp.]|nr:gluconolactonase [Novosphingobium sp.]